MWNEPAAEQLAKLPKLYKTKKIPPKDKIIYLHFFISATDLYIAEYDGKDIFYGFTVLNGDDEMAEWGYISFQELREVKVGFLEVDNDLHWRPKPAGEIEALKKCPNAFQHSG